MSTLRFATFGAGFWAQFQLAAWRELPQNQCVAISNPTRSKAEALAKRMEIAGVYSDPAELLAKETLDFVDIISSVESHYMLAQLAIDKRLPVICQKPMTETFEQAEHLVRLAKQANVPLFVHENFRWQAPVRAAAALLSAGAIGEPFRGRIDFISGFPVFDNQPALKSMNPFILMDVGTHVLDVARFLFGEASKVYCQAQQIHTDIAGEDVATVTLSMKSGATVLCQMAYAGTPVEREAFPQPLLFVEGTKGSLELGPDCTIRLTTAEGTKVTKHLPPRYPWLDPAYAVVHASIVPCNRDILNALLGQAPAETTGEDNLETLRLVFAAIESARSGLVQKI
ncbi:MAG: Gfo/Idh/MocA family oxidoreductase [Deltaproteobacteria bacterium]|nr:Gfo/Idh/MocA family oxidoreductase [Deltaproteobacteria bacterium]